MGTLAATATATAAATAMGAAVGTAERSTEHRTRCRGNPAAQEARWHPLIEQSRLAVDVGEADVAGVVAGVGAAAAACTAAHASSLADGTCVRPAAGKHFAATVRRCSRNFAFFPANLRWRTLAHPSGRVQTQTGRSSVLDPLDPGSRRNSRGLGAEHERRDHQEYGHSQSIDDQNMPITILAETGPAEPRTERRNPLRSPIQTRSLWRCLQLTESS